MGKMSEISLEIQERLAAGQDPEVIARALEVPIEWVLVEVDHLLESLEG